MTSPLLGPTDVDTSLSPEIYQKACSIPGYVESDDIMIHYTVTRACPFNCRGCINALTAASGNKAVEKLSTGADEEEGMERDIRGIAQLIRESGKAEAVLVYYGGEPMLRLDKMNRIYEGLHKALDGTPFLRFVVITSGHYLDRAVRHTPELASNMWLTAVSIDGTEEQHDAARRGTSLAVIRRQLASLNRIRKGEVVIWSTLRPGMSLLDCFRSFMFFHDRGEAEHFFWHCDEAEGTIPDLPGYLQRYRRDLETIMEACMDHLSHSRILSVVHVNDLILYLLTRKRRGTTACGVERMTNFDFIGDGKVHACADLPEAMAIGSITESGEVLLKEDARERLQAIVKYKESLGCDTCGIEPYCGGRCPVQANTGGIDRARQYCFMMREHVRTVKGYMGHISELLVRHEIPLSDLYRSARYTKYTDVTP